MAKRIRFPLEMENDIEVRNLEELKDNFSLARVIGYINDGKLITWLQDRYENELAEEVKKINVEAEDAAKKICELFDVEYDETAEEEVEKAEERKRKLELLKKFPDRMEYAKYIDLVAFDQDDLYDLLDENVTSSRLEDYWPVDDTGAKVGDTNPLAFAQIDSITIDRASGQITATLKDTDEQISIGFLAVGNVTNPNGVSHAGESYYNCGAGAGDLQVSMLGGIGGTLKTVGGGTLEHVNGSLAPVDANGDPVDLSDKAIIGSAGTTKLYTGGLETSNVDLATEISEMITTQRGYQANTRIVTVTDSMLEELVNMKR